MNWMWPHQRWKPLNRKQHHNTMIKIKAEYGNTIIAFGDNGVVLSKRSQSDLVNLGIIAHESKNPNLIKLFESLPSIDDLRRTKLEAAIQKYQAVSKPQPAPKLEAVPKPKVKKVERKK